MSKNIDPSGSLELLLDTICNTFGGIIFIAILTAILLQLSGKTASTQVAAADARDPAHKQAMAAERDALSQALSQQDALLRQFKRSVSKEEIARMQSLRAAKERLVAENHGRRAEIEKLEKEALQAAATSQAAEKQLTREQQRVSELQDQLKREKKARAREARLPKLHGTRKREIPIFLVQNRLSLLVQPNRLRSVNHDDFEVEGAGTGHATVRLKEGHGTVIADDKRARERIGDIIGGFDKDNEYLAVFVTADSFDVFGELRAAMIEHGFEYRLVPLAKSEPLHEGSGPGLVQ